MIMMEFKLENRTQVEALQNQIWQVFDILRGESITTKDYFVGLFLISLYKDGFITPDFLSRRLNIVKQIKEKVDNSSGQFSSPYSDIYEIFRPVLDQLSFSGLSSIIQELLKLDRKALELHYFTVFEQLLYRLARSQGRDGGEFLQPVEVTNLIIELAGLSHKSKVYNPFAGAASFGVFIGDGHDYLGQEIDERTWAIGSLRILAKDRKGITEYVSDHSIFNWPVISERFDLIVAHPPFSFPFRRHFDDFSNYSSLEHFVINKGIESLANDGKLVVLLSQGILYGRGHEKHLRQYLVDNDLIDTIISLPSGILKNTSIPAVILLINKLKESPGKVRLIDGKDFVESKNYQEKIINANVLIDILHGSSQDTKSLREVNIDDIRSLNYDLSIPRYFQKKVEGIKLEEILKFVKGGKGDLPNHGKLIRIRDLKEDNVDFKLDVANIEESEFRSANLRLIDESCLLLATRWKTLKPTYFEFSDTPIFLNSDILSFNVNEKIADTAYIINELHADYIQEQLDSFRLGTTIPMIRRDDLLEVVIKLPSLQEQKAKVKGIFELSDKIKIMQEERNAIANGVSSKLYESVSTIKHSLGKPLLNIGSSLRNIEKALSKLNTDWEQIKLNERYDLTIKDSFISVYRNLELIHSMLRNNESMLDVSNYKLTEIDLLEFVKGYVIRIKSAERSNVSITLDIHPDIKIQLKNKILIRANAELLEIALNAIVENANMHAFTEDFRKYKLEFRVSLYVAPNIKKQVDNTIGRFDTYVKMEVANNGNPFPKNYSLAKLIRKNSFAGDTGNTGQGGFDLNEIVKYHNNGMSTLELITDDLTAEFTTTYSFLIPFNR